MIRGTRVAGTTAVVPVRRAELFPVGGPRLVCRSCHRIAGVTAVPVHRQPVVVSLVADGERRVFSPVPLTVGATDLPKPTFSP